MKSQKGLQRMLLILGVLALVFLLVEVTATLVATQHGSTPERVEQITVGQDHFRVSLYDSPARAGFALPFAIAPQGSTRGNWSYQVTSIPQGSPGRSGEILMSGGRIATPVKASVSPDPQHPGGVQGIAEITVAGAWDLYVVVNDPSGQQSFDVSLTAVTLPPMPGWLGWSLGFLPVLGAAIFLVLLRLRKEKAHPSVMQVG